MIERNMRRKVFFLISCIGIAFIIIAGVRFINARSPKTGELRVDSIPVVSIFLNNRNIGVTPYREKIDIGEYTIKLVPQSASDQTGSWEGKISIGQNLLTYVNAMLSSSELTSAVDTIWLEKITSRQSELSVTTNPDGATVLVDDVVRGITPITLQDITAGEHTVSITNTGFQTRTLSIRTTPGFKLIASFKLALAPGGTGQEASSSATPSATLTSGGKTKSSTSSATSVPDPEKPFIEINDTPTGFLRVREEPSTTATEAGRVNPGEKYTILDTQGGWYEITFDGKNTGWVSGQYTQKTE